MTTGVRKQGVRAGQRAEVLGRGRRGRWGERGKGAQKVSYIGDRERVVGQGW